MPYSTYFTEQREKQENNTRKGWEKTENQEWEIVDRQGGGSIPHAEREREKKTPLGLHYSTK